MIKNLLLLILLILPFVSHAQTAPEKRFKLNSDNKKYEAFCRDVENILNDPINKDYTNTNSQEFISLKIPETFAKDYQISLWRDVTDVKQSTNEDDNDISKFTQNLNILDNSRIYKAIKTDVDNEWLLTTLYDDIYRYKDYKTKKYLCKMSPTSYNPANFNRSAYIENCDFLKWNFTNQNFVVSYNFNQKKLTTIIVGLSGVGNYINKQGKKYLEIRTEKICQFQRAGE